jgi:broad specificity phosphatase PhoE
MLGLKGRFESYASARKRAEVAAEQLVELSQQNGDLVLFGHGYMNLHIRRSLRKKGWRINSKSNDFWGLSSLTLELKSN